MIEISGDVDIHYPAEGLFDLITALNMQDLWLTKSSAFRGTVDISSEPVMLGTTYREPGVFGVRNGKVVEFSRPSAIVFHQPMNMRFGLGTIDVTVRYDLAQVGTITRVQRSVKLQIPRPLKAIQAPIVSAFRTESQRTLFSLKTYADHLGQLDR